MKLSGAEMVVKSLEAEGVDTTFGIPGGTVIPLFDSFYDSSIRQILTRHEQAAAHAADGYSRASGRVGVCVATSGPGATNLVTGIATASRDSIPIVAVTGQVSTQVIGTDYFQEADILGITLPIVKHSMQVRRASGVAEAIKSAFIIAQTGRPGPVLVDVPLDVQREKDEWSYPQNVTFRGYNPDPVEDLTDLDKAVCLLREAARPVIVTGGGVIAAEASAELLTLAEKLQIPVITSLMGKGSFPDSNPLCLGLVGMHGHAAANHAVIEADVILAVGTRFSDRSTGKVDTYAPRARVIHIDRDPAEIDKTIGTTVWLLGDAARVLKVLGDVVDAKSAALRKPWLERIAKWREDEPTPRIAEDGMIKPWQVLDALNDVSRENVQITTEVGQHQMWAALYLNVDRPRRFMTSGGLGTMGFGFPAAMGAAMARPDLQTVCIAGDGSFLMNAQELDTCARFNIPVKVFILNNSCLGMVRQWQELFYDQRYSNTLYPRDPDFVKLSESLGVNAFRVEKPEAVRGAIDRALETPGPVVVDFKIPQCEKVFPMVPPGAGIEEMILPKRSSL